MKTAKDILFECYVNSEKGDGTTEVELKAMQAYADQQVNKIVDKIEHEMELEEKAASSPPSVHPTQHYITLKWVLNCIDKIKQP